MDCIDSVELAALIHEEPTTEAVMTYTMKSILADAIDDAEEVSMADMSRETFDLLHECMDVVHQADLEVHAVTRTMRRFLVQAEAVDREIDEMLAAPH